ncbi:MAG: DUF134 domain-containing protein [Candidatus Heimdallarchaeota archaeon]|nr:DUF134 domain-containing protein [Candidatus Heimdallarchaeota archaeon]
MRQYKFRHGKGHQIDSYEEESQRQFRGRPLKEVYLQKSPDVKRIIPEPTLSNEKLTLTLAEYEALRLVDLLGHTQEEAGEKMNISRTAIWRLLDSARKKLVKTIVEGKEVILEEETKV